MKCPTRQTTPEGFLGIWLLQQAGRAVTGQPKQNSD